MIQFIIDGLPEPEISRRVEVEVRRTLRQLGKGGEWDIVLLASDTRDVWDLGLRGPSGHRRFTWFAATAPEEIPARAVEHVRRLIES
jgi:hypothetical protein